jgi:hypothetical protein
MSKTAIIIYKTQWDAILIKLTSVGRWSKKQSPYYQILKETKYNKSRTSCCVSETVSLNVHALIYKPRALLFFLDYWLILSYRPLLGVRLRRYFPTSGPYTFLVSPTQAWSWVYRNLLCAATLSILLSFTCVVSCYKYLISLRHKNICTQTGLLMSVNVCSMYQGCKLDARRKIMHRLSTCASGIPFLLITQPSCIPNGLHCSSRRSLERRLDALEAKAVWRAQPLSCVQSAEYNRDNWT